MRGLCGPSKHLKKNTTPTYKNRLELYIDYDQVAL